ncbi:MAG: hypothetical protein U5N53_12040 [Mycobacterium sp.]|nr:hypothetical protein [Mycobacterium sp.]
MTVPLSASMRTSSLGLRLATATVRVFAPTTTPSGASPMGSWRPGSPGAGAGARWGSAGGGRPSTGGRVPSVGTPVGNRPVVVALAGWVAAVGPGTSAGSAQPATVSTSTTAKRRCRMVGG